MRTKRLSVACALLGVLLCVRGGAHADYDETEIRLKSVGVSAPLRKKVHVAIERGADYLLSKQHPDGHWDDDFNGQHHWGVTALCALALRHAGGAKANAGARRAMEWLVSHDSLLPPGLEAGIAGSMGGLLTASAQVYEAGIFLMLLAADSRPATAGTGIARRLAGGIDPASGWWGYGTSRSGVDLIPGMINLSVTQFAALGLWAASRMGIHVDPKVWSRHAEGLLSSQQDGSWGYTPVGIEHPNDAPYPTGTFMGCANLALVRAVLRGPRLTRALEARLDAAHAAALDALRRDGRAFLATAGKRPPKWDLIRFRGGFSYYTLYALEKACIFLDLEKLGDVPWYVSGAQTLLAFQGKDGSWAYEGGDDPFVSTAFALLFLVRSSQTYHPVSPRTPDGKPPPAVTPDVGK